MFQPRIQIYHILYVLAARSLGQTSKQTCTSMCCMIHFKHKGSDGRRILCIKAPNSSARWKRLPCSAGSFFVMVFPKALSTAAYSCTSCTALDTASSAFFMLSCCNIQNHLLQVCICWWQLLSMCMHRRQICTAFSNFRRLSSATLCRLAAA